MVINKRVYGKLTLEKINRILDKLAHEAAFEESE
jgi:NADH:ubiquinone oxidoreductase subunit E